VGVFTASDCLYVGILLSRCPTKDSCTYAGCLSNHLRSLDCSSDVQWRQVREITLYCESGVEVGVEVQYLEFPSTSLDYKAQASPNS